MKSLARSLSTLDGHSLLGLEKAAQREATRRASARSLIDFTCYTYPRYEPAGLHRQIAEQLERVERGEVDRLMLLVPPRHGKSELASRRFPAWYLGRHTDQHFISASASFALAEDFGRDVRNLMIEIEKRQRRRPRSQGGGDGAARRRSGAPVHQITLEEVSDIAKEPRASSSRSAHAYQ